MFGFKPTLPCMKAEKAPHRRNLSPKHMPRGWYKGVGVRNVGRWTKNGQYLIENNKLLNFNVPDLSTCQLKPYVSKKTPLIDIKPMKIADLYGEPEQIPEHILLREEQLQNIKSKSKIEAAFALKDATAQQNE